MKFLRFPLLLSLLLALACGDDDSSMTDAGSDATSDTSPDSAVPDNGVANDELAPTECAAFPDCDGTQVESACACVPRPLDMDSLDANLVGCTELMTAGGAERTPENDFCDGSGESGTPNFACNAPGGYLEVGESQNVTVYGIVDVFGNGGDADAIDVEIYLEGENGALGELVGSATAMVEDPCSETEDEIEDGEVTGTRSLGFYFIENVPTETPLIVKTHGNPSFWHDIYSYNIYISNSEVDTAAPAEGACETFGQSALQGARWNYRARILSSSDWTSIPLTAGLIDGIRPTHGVVAGEAHDCDDVRLEFAQIATNPEADVFTYFNDNPDNPLPAVGRQAGTSLLGLYAALDVPEGPIDVAGVVRQGGALESVGWYRAQVFPGAVTTVTLRGIRPHQVPSE